MIPNRHEELAFSPDDAVETYRNLRDFYYKCVQEVYFDEKAADENFATELEGINTEFNILLEELE